MHGRRASGSDRSAPEGGRLIRSFLAIELAGAARPAVERLLAELCTSGADVAWTRSENLHLTLKFLGGVEPGRLERLIARLTPLALAHPSFVLTVSGVGAFPSLRRPRVIWVGVAAPGLAALASAVDGVCGEEGFEPEQRPFHPHLTLGRVRMERRSRREGAHGLGALSLETLAGREQAFGASPANALTVYRSRLGKGGARYEPLARLPLGS